MIECAQNPADCAGAGLLRFVAYRGVEGECGQFKVVHAIAETESLTRVCAAAKYTLFRLICRHIRTLSFV